MQSLVVKGFVHISDSLYVIGLQTRDVHLVYNNGWLIDILSKLFGSQMSQKNINCLITKVGSKSFIFVT